MGLEFLGGGWGWGRGGGCKGLVALAVVLHRVSLLFNVGTGVDLPIKDLSLLVKKCVGYEGEVVWDSEKPNGTPRKLMDVSKINKMGWRSSIPLEDGVLKVYKEKFLS